ncbi:FkbM family methyltransferase [Flavobacteriales bacterium AH-315-E23]|nr:FkbM family methyltransferase [Flavobacteriales bacterium AH-315-E23]
MKKEASSFSSPYPNSGLGVSTAHSISRLLRNHSIKGAGWMRHNFTRWFAGKPSGPVVTSLEGGIKLVLDPSTDKGLESILYYHGSYELGTLDLISKCINPGDTFLDAGANIGLFSIYLSKNCSDIKVCAFEPLMSTYSILRQNIDINLCDNIRTFPFALGIAKYKEKIAENLDMSRGSASMVKPEGSEFDRREVDVEKLDDVMVEEQIENVGVVKIDVEGWEQHVLLGAGKLLRKKDTPIWVIEHNSTQESEGTSPSETWEYMLANNEFQAFKALKGKQIVSPLVPINSVADLPENDNIFYFTQSHIDRLPNRCFIE